MNWAASHLASSGSSKGLQKGKVFLVLVCVVLFFVFRKSFLKVGQKHHKQKKRIMSVEVILIGGQMGLIREIPHLPLGDGEDPSM